MAGIVWLGAWRQIPLMIGLSSAATVAAIVGAFFYCRRLLRSYIRTSPRVAIPLEERRLSQYFNWWEEAALAVAVAAS